MLQKSIVWSLVAFTALPANAESRDISLRSFERALAAQPSATAALTGWCGAHAIANPAQIVAEPVGEEYPGPIGAVRKLLGVGAEQPVVHRNVRLNCGATTLSVAYNWYVPGLLTPEMNQALTTTTTPFGAVIAPLGFTRQLLAFSRGAMNGCPRDSVLSHLARLNLPDGRTVSVVIECYTAANLRQPEP
jgi:hypothetical protein